MVDTFVAVRSPRRRRTDPDDLGSLLGVLRDVHTRARPTPQKRQPREREPDAGEPEEDEPAMAELYAAIAALPEDFRDAVVAVDLMGLSHREAARALRTRESILSIRVDRGRRRLAVKLRQPDR